MNLFGQIRLAGRHVHHDAARFGTGQQTLAAQKHLLDITGHAHDRQTHIGCSSDFGGRISPRCTSVNQRLSFGFRSRKKGRLVAGVHQVATHAQAHHARADPSDFCFCWIR